MTVYVLTLIWNGIPEIQGVYKDEDRACKEFDSLCEENGLTDQGYVRHTYAASDSHEYELRLEDAELIGGLE